MSRLWMIAYDIVDDARRRRIADILENFGRRVQWSVFECQLGRNELDELRLLLQAEMDQEMDSIRWYPVCEWCRDRVVWQGQGDRGDHLPYTVI